jgi:LPXTG-motif cell wall-anchored protein/uncharacterized repeat protein (TIGR01451 family)
LTQVVCTTPVTSTTSSTTSSTSQATQPPPVVGAISLSKSANPDHLPFGGGAVLYTYVVRNAGSAPITSVHLTDDKCSPVTLVSGDGNNNLILDVGEVWTYQCNGSVAVTTTNTATVTASWDDPSCIVCAGIRPNVILDAKGIGVPLGARTLTATAKATVTVDAAPATTTSTATSTTRTTISTTRSTSASVIGATSPPRPVVTLPPTDAFGGDGGAAARAFSTILTSFGVVLLMLGGLIYRRRKQSR